MNDERLLFDGKPVITFADEQDRRRFLRNAALIGFGSSLVVSRWGDAVGLANAQGGTNDLDILQYALALEQLEATFYTKGLAAGLLSGRELELVAPIQDHERTHVVTVSATIRDLGATPNPKPQFTFPSGTFSDRETFLQTASTFEELGVNAYHGQVANIDSEAILAAAASIAGVESRHAAILADLIGGEPFPAPFEAGKPMSFVLDAADPFIA